MRPLRLDGENDDTPFRWMQLPVILVYAPGVPDPIVEPLEYIWILPQNIRVDEWMRSDDVDWDHFIMRAGEEGVFGQHSQYIPWIHQIFWSPAKPDPQTGPPEKPGENEVEVTEKSFVDLMEMGIKSFCNGEVPEPPWSNDEQPEVYFILRTYPKFSGSPISGILG